MSSAVENMQQEAAVRKPSLLFPLKQSREHVLLADSSEKAWALKKKSLDYGRDATPPAVPWVGLHHAEIGNCSGSDWSVRLCLSVATRVMLGNIIKCEQATGGLLRPTSPQVFRDVFQTAVWTSLNGGRKNQTIPMRKITGKYQDMFQRGEEAKVWSQELKSVVAMCIFWNFTDLLKVFLCSAKICSRFWMSLKPTQISKLTLCLPNVFVRDSPLTNPWKQEKMQCTTFNFSIGKLGQKVNLSKSWAWLTLHPVVEFHAIITYSKAWLCLEFQRAEMSMVWRLHAWTVLFWWKKVVKKWEFSDRVFFLKNQHNRKTTDSFHHKSWWSLLETESIAALFILIRQEGTTNFLYGINYGTIGSTSQKAGTTPLFWVSSEGAELRRQSTLPGVAG